MDPYIFQSQAEDRELHRLKLIEDAFDAASIACLKKTNIQTGWRCLEIGPGAGSILSWMEEKAGPGGRVVGIDKNTQYIQNRNSPPFDIIQGDFSDLTFNEPFHVAHARYVLIHNHEAREMIPKIKQALKPGGLAVLEEPDFTVATFLNNPADHAQARVNRAICKMFSNLDLNPAYGLTLPQKLTAAGFEVLEVISRLHLAPGLSPVAKVMGASAAALRAPYLATGEANKPDLDQYIANTQNPEYWTVYYSTISVIARKPL